MPNPTDAAKIAVRAAALATSAALSSVRKYGRAQTAKSATSNSHSTRIPRSRRNTRARTPAVPPASVGRGDRAHRSDREAVVITR